MVSQPSKVTLCRQQNRSNKTYKGMHEVYTFGFCEEGAIKNHHNQSFLTAMINYINNLHHH